MNVLRYRRAREIAWPYAAPGIESAFRLTRGIPVELPRSRKAIYIAVGPMPGGDGSGLVGLDGQLLGDPTVQAGTEVVRYVGSTTQTVQKRLTGHFADFDRGAGWTAVWVIPLIDATPHQVVLGLEGAIGALLRPTDNQRLPRPRGLACVRRH